MKTIFLKNGLMVANFSSPHPFNFDDGTILPACSKERAKELMLNQEEINSSGINGTIDIDLKFKLNSVVATELERVKIFKGIIIVPLPVLSAMKEAGSDIKSSPFRVVRMVNRIDRIVSSEKFCI